MKRVHKKHAGYHLNDLKMEFLAAVISGADTHLRAKGTLVEGKLGARKSKQFADHIVETFADSSERIFDNIEHDAVYDAIDKHHSKFVNAARKSVEKSLSSSGGFNHQEIISLGFDAFDKVHAKVLNEF